MNKSATNPYSAYRVEFPYTCTFTLPDDGHVTSVTINTRSVAVRYGNDENDVLQQVELDKFYGDATYAKHIIKWVEQRLCYIDPRKVDVAYEGETIIAAMTETQIEEFTEDCLEE
jgi:hypothetical protein